MTKEEFIRLLDQFLKTSDPKKYAFIMAIPEPTRKAFFEYYLKWMEEFRKAEYPPGYIDGLMDYLKAVSI